MTRSGKKITTDVYRKPTHTDQYLHWTSNHPVQQKIGIVKTLMHRAETLIEDKNLLEIERNKIRVALKNCGYPDWAITEGEQPKRDKKQRDTESRDKGVPNFVILPYMKGVTERLRHSYNKYHVQLHCTGGQTLR